MFYENKDVNILNNVLNNVLNSTQHLGQIGLGLLQLLLDMGKHNTTGE